MDDVVIIGIVVVGFLLLSKNASASTSSATNSLLSPLQQALQALQTALNKASSGGGGGGAAPKSDSSAAQSALAGVSAGNQTPEATIDALATDGNASDGQVAAYLQALNEGDTALANSIIGNDQLATLENDPSAGLSTTIPLESTPTYDTPPIDYGSSTGGGDDDLTGDDDGGEDDDE